MTYIVPMLNGATCEYQTPDAALGTALNELRKAIAERDEANHKLTCMTAARNYTDRNLAEARQMISELRFGYEKRINELLDPIVRAKMMEIPPAIFIEKASTDLDERVKAMQKAVSRMKAMQEVVDAARLLTETLAQGQLSTGRNLYVDATKVSKALAKLDAVNP